MKGGEIDKLNKRIKQLEKEVLKLHRVMDKICLTTCKLDVDSLLAGKVDDNKIEGKYIRETLAKLTENSDNIQTLYEDGYFVNVVKSEPLKI